MKRVIIFLIIAIITSCSFSSQLLALPEGAIARLGFGSVSDVKFSPGGSMLAIACSAGIYLYDPITLAQVDCFSTDVASVAFSPDGVLLASGSRDKTIKLWDVKSRTNIATLSGHTGYVFSVAFSPDGNILASGSGDDTIKLWDVKSRTEITTLMGTGLVRSVAFSPDGSLLASGSRDKTIKLWDVKSRTNIATLSGHTDWVFSVAFSPDGSLLASGSRDKTIKLWDVKSRTNIATLSGHTYYVFSVAFSPDGNILASGSEDDTIKLWDVKSRTNIATLTGHTYYVFSVAFSPDGSLLASGGGWDGTIIWDVKSRTEITTLTGTGLVRSVAFSRDGSLLASGSRDGTIKLWDVKSRTNIATLKGHTYYVNSVAFSPDGNILASGSEDDTIKLWDVKSRTNIATLKGHTDYVNSVAFSPDGVLLASGSGNGTIKLWDVKSRTNIATLEGHTWSVFSVAFSPDGVLLASGSGNGTIKLWDVKSRTNIATLKGHTDYVNSVAFSPDGVLLASGSGDNTIKLWDVKSRTNIATLSGHTYYVFSVAFSPDGSLLASGGWDDTIKLWDVKSGSLIRTLWGHTGYVFSVAFNPDGSLLASGSWDHTIILWDMKPYIKGQSDTIAPSTTIKLSGNQDAKGVYTSAVTVTLTATDDLSGVKQTTYKIANGQWQVYSSPFVIKESTTITYKSEDNAGNVETEKTQEINIAKAPQKLRYIRQIPAGFIFTQNLSANMQGEEVKYLQVMLAEEGWNIYPEDYSDGRCKTDGYFGEWTRRALIKFQEKYKDDILTPSGLTAGTGFVRENTRKKLNELLNKYREEIKRDRVDTIYDLVKGFQNGTLDVNFVSKTDNIKRELPRAFPIELILAITSQETGLLYNYNNEIIGEDNVGRGIMQITTKSLVGSGSTNINDDIINCQNLDYPACYQYYSNTIQGVEANIRDGLHTLGEKYLSASLAKCKEYKNRQTGAVEITSDEMKLISTVQRYHYGYSHPKEDKERYIANIAEKLRGFNENSKKDMLFPLTNDERNNASIFARKFQIAWDNSQFISLHSPGELKIYDPAGNVTGLLNGKVVEGVPNSIYDEESKSIIVFASDNTYKYEVKGTAGGTYGLEITSIRDGQITTFNAVDIPTSVNAVHQYNIDWDSLASGKKGVTVSMDSNGDGKFEETINTGASFTEYNCDVNSDGIVNILDLVIVSKYFGKPASDNVKADVNKDGMVDILDLNIVIQHFGKSSP